MSSKLGQFIRGRKSWTLPDTRPQPAQIRTASKLTQLRVSAEAYGRDYARTAAQEHNKVSGLAGLAGRSSRPGATHRAGFRMTPPGEKTRGWARNRSNNMQYGPWTD